MNSEVLPNEQEPLQNQSVNDLEFDDDKNSLSNDQNDSEVDTSSKEEITSEESLNEANQSQESESASHENTKKADTETRLQQLEKEHETLKSQYMRIAADFDNFRKRQTRDNDDLRIQLTCNTLGEILPVIDNFERARQQLTPEGEEAQALHRSYQGLYKQLVEVLKKLGVAPMRVVGQKFDPNLHEAVMREPSDIHQEDIITEELQRGYHLDGRVIRHALVKVSMGPGSQNEDSSNPEEKSIEIDDAKDQEPEISKDDD